MSTHTKNIRRIARDFRAKILGPSSTKRIIPAEAVLAAADRTTGTRRILLDAGDMLLAGAKAVLDREANAIWQSSEQPEVSRLFDAAHEYGHLVLHSGRHVCAGLEGSGDQCDGDGIPLLAQTQVDGYSATQRHEREANLFAAELLLPSDILRTRFRDAGGDADAIVRETGLSATFVRTQMTSALLTRSDTAIRSSPVGLELDTAQSKAATWHGGALLIGAGPGSGKTRALIARCLHLVHESDVPAESILALTFSRKASVEIRERLMSSGIGLRDAGPWIGTFHGFGMEILRRYGHRSRLRPGWRLLTGPDLRSLLEQNIDKFDVDGVRDIYTLSVHLERILSAISREKGELRTPHQSLENAQQMLQKAGKDVIERRNALQAIELAKAYASYEQVLNEANYIDMDDLVCLPVEILQRYPEIAAGLQREYPHILVDEYQDANRATTRLLKLMADADGRNLWLVGDPLQRIYGFRGASQQNIANFHADYPTGVRIELPVNYRSNPAIVSLISRAAGQIVGSIGEWTSGRIELRRVGMPPICLAAADSDEAQTDGIFCMVEEFRSHGYRYCDQAILCRTNSQAIEIGKKLASRGSAVSCPADLFRTAECLDMLVVAAAACQRPSSAIALQRFATLPGIGVSPHDASHLAALAVKARLTAEQAIRDQDIQQQFAPKPGFNTLRRILTALASEQDPATCIERFLFQESGYLSEILKQSDHAAMRTVRQTIQLARRLSASGQAGNKEDFLEYIRSLIERDQAPTIDREDDDDCGDSVRILTIHASKGLEFPIVYLPNLSEGRFPPARQSTEAEEQRIFLVALSRAMDHLILSRPKRCLNEDLPRTRLFDLIDDQLARLDITETLWRQSGFSVPPPLVSPRAEAPDIPTIDWGEIASYLTCPRQCHYERIGLAAMRDRSPDDDHIEALGAAIAWLRAERSVNRYPTTINLLARYDSMLVHKAGSRTENKELARKALDNLRSDWTKRRLKPLIRPTTLTARLESATVQIQPDLIAIDPEGKLIIEKHILDPRQEQDQYSPEISLLTKAAIDSAASRTCQIEIRYLATGERRPVSQTHKSLQTRLASVNIAAAGIACGDYPAEPSKKTSCGRCPYLFTCPK